MENLSSTYDGGFAKTPWVLLARLAIVNSIGFSGATIVPIWVASIGTRLDMPLWYGGSLATVQLLATSLVNLATPFVFSRVPPTKLAKIALPLAALSYLFTQIENPSIVFAAVVFGGAFLGIVLNATNRIVANSPFVRRGYTIFQFMEGLFSALFIITATVFVSYVDIFHVYLLNACVCIVGTVLFFYLPTTQISLGADKPAAQGGFGLPAVVTLFALLIFFIGQNSVLSFSVPLGEVVELAPNLVTSTISLGLIVSLGGAILSEVVGARWGLARPLLAATSLLIMVFLAMTQAGSAMTFLIGIIWMMTTTMFVVPYFFTLLARLDPLGKAASVGPAFLLIGVALGSAMATTLTTIWDVSLIGPAAAGALLISCLLIMAVTRQHVH
ncbi:MAG: MFS transporter [Pseudomonadota bacterium]